MSSNIVFMPKAWDDYLFWQSQDRKTLKRINQLVRDIERNGYDGIGKPEALMHEYSGWWSRRIDEQNRLVYRIACNQVFIASCRSHY